MPNLSATAEDDALSFFVSGTTYYLGLCTAAPGSTGANTTTLTYQPITFGTPSGGSQASTNAQTFSSVPGGVTYTDFSIWTAASGGTYIAGGALASSITPSAGSNIDIAIGGIVFTAS